MAPSDLFELIRIAISTGVAEFFYDNQLKKKCCVIGDAVLIFTEEEEGSFTIQYQNVFPLWMRETPGWDTLRSALAGVQEDEDADEFPIRRRVYAALLRQLSIATGNTTRSASETE